MGDLSKHFSRYEFQSKDGAEGYNTVDAELLMLCEEVRAFVGEPVTVTSGHRSPAHNRAVGGSPKSQHLLGKAADLIVPDPESVYDFLDHKFPDQYGFGCYVGSGFVHVDCRSNRARWGR